MKRVSVSRRNPPPPGLPPNRATSTIPSQVIPVATAMATSGRRSRKLLISKLTESKRPDETGDFGYHIHPIQKPCCLSLASWTSVCLKIGITIDKLINLLVMITLFEMVVAIGVGVTFRAVLDVARNWRLVTRAALANYIVVPATALRSCSTPTPGRRRVLVPQFALVRRIGPPFTEIARGDAPVAVGLMVILALVRNSPLSREAVRQRVQNPQPGSFALILLRGLAEGADLRVRQAGCRAVGVFAGRLVVEDEQCNEAFHSRRRTIPP